MKLIFGDFVAHVAAAANLSPVSSEPEIDRFHDLGGDVERDGTDALGHYDPGSGTILIDSARCHHVAAKLGVADAGLAGVVLLHEISHWVQHTGRCIYNVPWHNFAEENRDLVEELAQENTFFSILWFQRGFLDAMTQLSRRSPEPYRRWEKHLEIVDDAETALRKRSEFARRLWNASNRGSVTESRVLFEPIDE